MLGTDYSFDAQADLPGVAFAAMRLIILAQAKAANMTVLEDSDNHLTVETAHGLIGLRPGETSEAAGMVAAKDARWLFVMKNAVLQQMRHLMPEVAEAMRWSDAETQGEFPPNFSFVRVREVVELGPVFLRVTLEGEDLSAHGDDAIHFRLVLPPRDAETQWPGVAANGSITWPEGPAAPHRPVYTARAVDYDANTILMDVFVHEGGRTTDWAQQLLMGILARQIVGIIGPSGGGLMQADHVLMASDETGFPAAARILENLPDGATGQVILEAEEGASCDYPIAVPEGLSLIWLSRAKGERLDTATLAALSKHKGAKAWFAGERAQATRVRETAKAAGWEAGDLRVSGFWRAAPAD